MYLLSRVLILCLLFSFVLNTTNAQIVTKEWENTIGGTANDKLYSIQQTTDGGYILGGSSDSGMSGDCQSSP